MAKSFDLCGSKANRADDAASAYATAAIGTTVSAYATAAIDTTAIAYATAAIDTTASAYATAATAAAIIWMTL